MERGGYLQNRRSNCAFYTGARRARARLASRNPDRLKNRAPAKNRHIEHISTGLSGVKISATSVGWILGMSHSQLKLEKPLKASGDRSTRKFRGFSTFLALFASEDL
jgi:hypothetical protein